jgi:hypothetical protein
MKYYNYLGFFCLFVFVCLFFVVVVVLQVCLSRGKLLAEKAVKDHVSRNLKFTAHGFQLGQCAGV